MDMYKITNELKTKSIYEIPLRVTFYARVSTDSEEQLNSLENQTSYYRELITKNENWTYVEGYVDEGLSAATTKKRESFHAMIADAKNGKFDLIITKEITRFARNTLDSIQYTRELLRHGVCVFFQNDNINTAYEDSELRLTIMSGIAQDELRKLSSRIKFGHQQAIKNGVVLGNSRMFGYRKQNKRLVIDEKEAEMVREIYELYATDNYSMNQIEKILWDKGYRNHNGNIISHSTISNTIANPKYKGYYVGNKVKIIDLFTKTQKFLPQEEWVMYKDETGEIVPAIVSEELWAAANAVLKRRSQDVKTRQNKCTHANLLTGKLYCTHCNAPFYRKDSTYKGEKLSRWVCSGKIKNGANSCPTFAIKENEIQKLLISIFLESKDDSEKYIDKFLEMYKSTLTVNTSISQTKYKKIIANLEQKKDKILQFNLEGKITDKDFVRMYDKCNAEIEEAEAMLRQYENEQKSLTDISNELALMRKSLQEAVLTVEQDAKISIPFVNKYIDRISVTAEGDNTLTLDVKLFSSEELSKSICRTGHTILNICPVQQKEISRIDRTKTNHQVITYFKVNLII